MIITPADEKKLAFIDNNWAPPVDDDTNRLPEPGPMDSGQAKRAWADCLFFPE